LHRGNIWDRGGRVRHLDGAHRPDHSGPNTAKPKELAPQGDEAGDGGLLWMLGISFADVLVGA
jgi:hypothetical protein